MLKSTRRQFLTYSAATTGILLAPGFVRAQSATPKRGGHLKIGFGGASTKTTLDPRPFTGDGYHVVAFAVYNRLVGVSPKTELVPELATSWESPDRGRTWNFKLREKVTFHDGKPFTSADAIASIQLHMGEDSGSALRSILSPIASLKADGDNAFILELKSPNLDFPAVFSEVHLPMLPSKDGKADWESGIGCGAYKIESFEPGVTAKLLRFDGYWNAEKAGYLDSVEIIVANDATARMNALRSGEVDVINKVEPTTAKLLARVPNIAVKEVPSGQHAVMAMFCDTAPFTDVNVRLALKYALNREELVQKVYQGMATVGNDNPVSRFHKYYADIPQRPYDPEKAKFHLKKAGMENLSVDLSVADIGFNGAIMAGELFQQSAKSAGININPIRESEDSYFETVWMKKPFTVDYWGYRGTADWILSLVYARGSNYNESHWDNDKFNKLLNDAKSETNEDTRTSMYRDMQILVHEDGGSIIPIFTHHVWASNKRVKTPDQVASNYELDGYRCIERWWIDE